ncbi:MAG: SOS response-associated peptidase [Candidatus Excrementavichristensenella sp.]|jgi:putative SOS response-associated peptidase YedK
MCGRYYVESDDPSEPLERIIRELENRGQAVGQGEIRPGTVAAVVANNIRGLPTPFAMHWGYGMGGKLIINARSETVGEKPLFADGILRRRCLIPASCYFEWEKRGRERICYAISPKGKPFSYLAGIYRKEGTRASFVVLTRPAAPEIAFIHHRMPVILAQDAFTSWLDPHGDPEAVMKDCLQEMEYRPVG